MKLTHRLKIIIRTVLLNLLTCSVIVTARALLTATYNLRPATEMLTGTAPPSTTAASYPAGIAKAMSTSSAPSVSGPTPG